MTEYCLKFLRFLLRSIEFGIRVSLVILNLIVIDDVLRFVTLTGISKRVK